MKIQLVKNFLKRAILLIAPFLFIACESDNGEIGRGTIIGLPPGVDSVHVRVLSFTQDVDSVLVGLDYSTQLSLGGYAGSRLVGSMEDNFVGTATAGIVTEVIPTQLNMDFGTNPIVDSVKLYLRYNGIYGDSTKTMGLEVYELAESLSRDSLFYSSFKPVLGQKIGEVLNFKPQPNTPVKDGSATLSPTLIVPMDVAYFQSTFADVGDGSNPDFGDFDSFIEYFKGIHIKTTVTDGSILYFNLATSSSKIVISYHNDSDTTEVVVNFMQDKSSIPIAISVFSQDYSNAVFDINNPDSLGLGAMTTYTQAMGGVATVVKLPEILNILEDGSVINRAFLEVPVQRGIVSGLPPSGRMEIREMTSDGPGPTVRDFNFDTRQTGDGSLRLGEFRDNKYVFELTEHIFEVLNNHQNPNLAIVPVSKGTTANRTILKGGNDPLDPIKLIIYYTKP